MFDVAIFGAFLAVFAYYRLKALAAAPRVDRSRVFDPVAAQTELAAGAAELAWVQHASSNAPAPVNPHASSNAQLKWNPAFGSFAPAFTDPYGYA